jgi:dUTP pyrophosphatase
MDQIQTYKINPEATLPTRNIETDAGLDIYSSVDMFIPLESTVLVATGIALNIPRGYVGKIEDRSSMALKGLKTGAGVVDSGFSGELSIVLHNLTCSKDSIQAFNTMNNNGEWTIIKGYKIKKGDKIAQMLIYKVETPQVVEVNQLWDSERSDKGWGSSGR